MTTIRPSHEADLHAISAIYAHHVLRGTGTFEVEPPSDEEMSARRADVLGKKLPHLVIESQGQVVGFAYCNWFKPRPAYRFSAEDSIYLDPNAAGQGFGKLLLSELIVQAERAGIRQMVAVIGDSANQASIGVHLACGFAHAGVLPACGWKFDRWLDVVMMQRSVGQGALVPPQIA